MKPYYLKCLIVGIAILSLTSGCSLFGKKESGLRNNHGSGGGSMQSDEPPVASAKPTKPSAFPDILPRDLTAQNVNEKSDQMMANLTNQLNESEKGSTPVAAK